jgi:hypothetical protein
MLDADRVKTQGTPEWWMVQLSKKMLDRERVKRLSLLQAWVDNTPPIAFVSESQQKAFYAFLRMARVNMAGAIVRSRVHRMTVRSIKTAAAGDDQGDAVANHYYTTAGLRAAAPAVHQDYCTFGEGYLREFLDPDDETRPLAVRLDPRYCVTAQDPLNPQRTIAAMYLVWDEWAGRDYAYLWLPGEQWVAERERRVRPTMHSLEGVYRSKEDVPSSPYWRLTFSADTFDMRPEAPADRELRDGRPYSQTFASKRLPVTAFLTRDGKGQFEDVLPSLKRINQSLMQTMTTAAVQAYKQRALQQEVGKDGKDKDRLPPQDSKGVAIDWDAVFEPGPDALWKLPPGVSIWESGQVDLTQFYAGEMSSIRQVAMETGTPIPMLTDDTNQSAEGAQNRKEDLEFIVNDLIEQATPSWAGSVSDMFEMAPEEDRYADGADRADAGQIVIEWAPVQRYSLAEKADADTKSSSLSIAMKCEMIWGMTPDQVQLNLQQLKDEAPEPPPAPVVVAPPAADAPPIEEPV